MFRQDRSYRRRDSRPDDRYRDYDRDRRVRRRTRLSPPIFNLLLLVNTGILILSSRDLSVVEDCNGLNDTVQYLLMNFDLKSSWKMIYVLSKYSLFDDLKGRRHSIGNIPFFPLPPLKYI